MGEIAPLFAGEVQLAGWNESHTGGCKVTFWLTDPSELDVFRGLTARKGNSAGHRMACVLVEIGDDEKPVQPAAVPANDPPEGNPKGHRYGHEARALVTCGFFNPSNLRVLEAIGADAEYQDWCRKQPSALGGKDDYDPTTGEIRNEPAHVRRAGEAGTGYKPRFATIPLSHAQHQWQHQHGEAACLMQFLPPRLLPPYTQDEASAWFDKARDRHVFAWAKSKLARIFGVESIGDISPASLYEWCTQHDIANFLPLVYRP